MSPSTKPFDDGDKNEPKIAEASMSSEELARRVRDLENTLAQTRAGLPLTQIPDNGAGIGTDVAETWSQAQQEEAVARAAMRATAKD